jgi:hypothetical protein
MEQIEKNTIYTYVRTLPKPAEHIKDYGIDRVQGLARIV